jgi:serine/threonine-protein kinase
MPDLNPGVTFAGHRIEGVAGRGGMGTVYRATHLALDHVVALKVISSDLAADDAFRERFRSESRIAVSLRHPNVVSIHHAGEEDGLLFVTMDLIEGPDLRRMLVAAGTLEPERAVAIVGQVASALDVAHSRGLVHRDIKPGNVLVETDRDDHAYLTDFGLAKRFDQASEASGLTRTGAFVGTLDYVAPEQIRGGRVDARTDVYALGCVLYETIAGRAPFADREENVAKIYAHLQDEPPWLPGEDADAGALDEVIARALAKEQGDRFPSAGDLARAATAAIVGEKVLRSAERSVATGKAAPDSDEAPAPPVPDTVAAGPPPPPTEPGPPPTEDASSSPSEPGPPPTEPAAAATEPGPPPTAATAVPAGGEGPPTAATAAAPRAATAPRWGRIALALATLAGAVAVLAVLVLAGGDDSGGGDGSTGFEAPRVVGQPIAVTGFPVGVAVADGTVAVATREGRRVALFDEDGRAAGEMALPAPGEDVTIAAGSIWASVPDASAVLRADTDGANAQPIDVGAAPLGLGADGDTVYAAQPGAGSVAAIDAGDGSVDPIAIDGSSTPSFVAAGEGILWVVDRAGDVVFRLDPDDPGAAVEVTLGDNPKGVLVAAGSVWVADTGGGNVVRLSTGGDEEAEIEVGGEPRLLAYGFGRVWVTNGKNSVEAIDPADNTVQRVEVEGSPEGVAIGSEEVWVTAGKGDELVRIDPGV